VLKFGINGDQLLYDFLPDAKKNLSMVDKSAFADTCCTVTYITAQ